MKQHGSTLGNGRVAAIFVGLGGLIALPARQATSTWAGFLVVMSPFLVLLHTSVTPLAANDVDPRRGKPIQR